MKGKMYREKIIDEMMKKTKSPKKEKSYDDKSLKKHLMMMKLKKLKGK